MTTRFNLVKNSPLYWSMYFLILLTSGFLAMGSGYMAYKVTRESLITLGFAGIGFYVMYYLGSSLLLTRAK